MDILKVFTAEQLYELMKNKIIADNVGLTNFNEGSRIRSLLEAIALIESTTGFEYLDALRKSIRVAMYEGFGFSRKPANAASGYVTFYRKPAMIIRYTGNAASCTVTTTDTQMILTCTNPAHSLTIDYSAYSTTEDIANLLNTYQHYSASVIGSSMSANQLYHYTAKEIVGATAYNNNPGLDIMMQPANSITIPEGALVGTGDLVFRTKFEYTIQAGDAYINALCVCNQLGVAGNIGINAIDTENGIGTIMTYIEGVQHAINYSAFAGGTDEETEAERISRFQKFIQGLSGATESGITAAVLSIPGIKSVTVRDNYPQRGQITVVADDGTGTLSPEQVQLIDKVLSGDPLDYEAYPGYRAAGITVNITAPVMIPVNVVGTLYRIGTISSENEIINNAKKAVENYINTRKLGQDVVISEIIAAIQNSHPAIYDVQITQPTSNVLINTDEVPRTGTGTGASVQFTLITYNSEP